MTPRPLIAQDSPTYLRRMVRELNAHGGNGFYCGVACIDGGQERYNRARFHAGRLEIRMAFGHWIDATGHRFSDPCGKEIVASREA